MSQIEPQIGVLHDRSTKQTWVVALLLLVFALLPRVVNLNDLSFYADEDLSVLTASSVARGEGRFLPSGMEYRRAVPLTWMNAVSTRLVGGPAERAIRLPSAILGALTVPALFLLGRRWLGFGAGLTAALMLSVSEWHLVFSRQSRMYVPLLLFVVLSTWWLWTWVRTGRLTALAGGLVTAIVSIFLHCLGMLLAAAPLLWLAFPGAVSVPVHLILGVAGLIGLAGWAAGAFWIEAPYEGLPIPARMGPPPVVEPPLQIESLGWIGILLAAAGLLLAVAVVWNLGRTDDSAPGALLRRVARVGLALATGLAAGTGQLYAFAVAGALFLLVSREGVKPLLMRAAWPMLGMASLLAVHVGLRTLQVGVVEAIKLSAALPFPHAHTLFVQAPAPVTLFGLTALVLILAPYQENRWGAAAATILSFATLAAIGLVREAGPTRYLLTAYPMMILVAGAGLFQAAEWFTGRIWRARRLPPKWALPAATTLAAAVVFSGVLSGHGLAVTWRMMTLKHGEPVSELVHMFPFRPDHRGVGLYVREHRGPSDIVIAEDPLVQRWYAGQIDFWFRRYGDMRLYLRVHPDGVQRDIYVGSTALPAPASLDSLARVRTDLVWFITSAETVGAPLFYYSPDQVAWLDSLRVARRPAFVGEDGVSAVYCLNCPPR